MYPFKIFALCTLLLLLGATSGRGPGDEPAVVTIATASSLAQPIERISDKFEEMYNVDVRLVSASSGVLTTQIMHGAPFDIFISADLQYPRRLYDLYFAANPPKIITRGSLALWSKFPIDNQDPAEYIRNSALQTVAIANPDLAPFGRAAVAWLQNNQLYDKIKSNLVYGENIGNVNRFIHSDAVDLALTAASALHAPQLAEKGHWKLLAASGSPGIPHGALLIKKDLNRKWAPLFFRFLQSREAQKIFQQFGYKNIDGPS